MVMVVKKNGQLLSIKTDLRVCRFVASKFSAMEYNAIYYYYFKGYLSIYKNITWELASPLKYICDYNPSYFRFIKKIMRLKG